MYGVFQKKELYDIYELTDGYTDSSVCVCPERGGIITSFICRGKELIYMDLDTFQNPSVNIRGGIPILFPICGQLPDCSYTLNGRKFTIKNHGFARNSSWKVEETGTEPCAYIKISLSSTSETLSAYPFDFKLIFTYSLEKGKLAITQKIINTSCVNDKMPVHTGFHPYFKMSGKRLCHNIRSRELFDYNDMKTKIFTNPIDMSGKKEAVVVSSCDSGSIEFYEGSGGSSKIKMDFSPEYKYLMLWTVENCDFICVEPWTAKNKEFLRGDELIYLDKGEELDLFMSIERA